MTEPERRRELLRIARRSVEERLAGRRLEVPERPHAGETTHGVFVTLTKDGDLRGCIGTLSAEEGIARTVAEFACQAAFHDPRFPPLEAAELPDLHIEISILLPPHRILPEHVEAGRHGLILEHHGRRGLLLPQVAVEWKFSREEFLDAVAKKAGLPSGAWREAGARLYGFEAEVFGEEESGPDR